MAEMLADNSDLEEAPEMCGTCVQTILPLVFWITQVIRCAIHTSGCRICQNIRLRKGAHEEHILQSFLELKDKTL
jgi:hypothetical protein